MRIEEKKEEIEADYFFEEPQWNWLLSELALGRSDDEKFQRILNSLDTEKAKALKKDLNSFWR